MGAQRDLKGPESPDLVPTAANWSDWAGIMVTRHFDLVSGHLWAPRDPKRASICTKLSVVFWIFLTTGKPYGGKVFFIVFVPFSHKF